MTKSIRSGTEHNNKTTIPFKNFPCGGVGIGFSSAVYQLSFSIVILEALRKFKINNEACTSFKIEKIKLPLTMPLPRADLLRQRSHIGEDKVVKCPKMPGRRGGGGGGDARGWN